MRLIMVLATALAAAGSFGQAVLINSFATGYTQNFDTLPTHGNVSMTTNTLVGTGFNLKEWVFSDSENVALNTLRSDNGSSSTGGIYSYGATNASDRALGSLSADSYGDIQTGLRVKNNTGTSTGLFVFQFDIEQWRDGGNGPNTAQDIKLSYKLYDSGSYSTSDLRNGTGFSSANIVWQDINLTSNVVGVQHFNNSIPLPNAGNSANNALALNGNSNSNKRRIRAVVQLFNAHKSWDNGEELVFRISDENICGKDHGYGIDNIVAVPEPASMAILGIGLFGLASRRRRRG